MVEHFNTVRILGISFYNDSFERALEIAHQDGGLFLAPSGPGLADLGQNPHDAVTTALAVMLQGTATRLKTSPPTANVAQASSLCFSRRALRTQARCLCYGANAKKAEYFIRLL